MNTNLYHSTQLLLKELKFIHNAITIILPNALWQHNLLLLCLLKEMTRDMDGFKEHSSIKESRAREGSNRLFCYQIHIHPVMSISHGPSLYCGFRSYECILVTVS